MSSEASSNPHLRISDWGVETVLKLLQADQRNRPSGFDTLNELLLMFSPKQTELEEETTFEISITPPSAVPQWIQLSPISIERGTQAQTITLQYTDSDSNSANNTVEKVSGPAWAVLNPTARTLRITPPSRGTTSQPAQTFTVVVRVKDPAPNQHNSADMTITINLAAYTYTPPPVDPPPTDPTDPEETSQPPTLAQVANLIMDAGGSVGRVLHVADPDTPLEDVILTKTGVGTLTRLGDKRFYEYRYSESLPAADREQQVHTVNLSLTDGPNTITSSFTVTVRAYVKPPPPASNVAPRLNTINPITLDRGQQIDVPITYIDPDSPTSAITITRTGDGSIRTTGTGTSKKWFWRISTPTPTAAHAAETKTATISITDGEDSGNTITATANIRAYSPPSYFPNLVFGNDSGIPEDGWIFAGLIAATHDGTRVIPTVTATRNGTAIPASHIRVGLNSYTIRTVPDANLPPQPWPAFNTGDVFVITMSYTDSRYSTRNTTTITHTRTIE